MEFVHTARELRLYTIRKCAGFPKRYTFYISQPMAECATKIRALVTRANDIYPTHQHQAQMRADYLLLAKCLPDNSILFVPSLQREIAEGFFFA